MLFTRRRFVQTAALGSAAALSAKVRASAAARSSQGRPLNVVFVIMDDMGWTDASCFGSTYYETPQFERFAAEGMKFTSAYGACTVCSPSRAACLTGKYPARLHLTDFLLGEERPFEKMVIPDWQRYLPLNEQTIPKRLKQAGYRTAHIGKWHLGDPPHPFGYPANQGYDHTVGGCSSAHHLPPYNPLFLNAPDPAHAPFLTDYLTDAAVKFIEENRDAPFYLNLAHHAPHSPIEGKVEVIEKYRKKTPHGGQDDPVYAALIESVDDSIGRLLDTLKRLGLEKNTVVFFTSDHGGEIGGANWRDKATDNSPLRGGKGNPYEGGVRVPTIVKWPGVTKPGSVCDTPIIGVDYFPTILEATGLAGPKDAGKFDGVSIVPLLSGSADSLPRDAIYWHFPHYHSPIDSPYSAVRAGPWKLIHFFDDDHVELYNLQDDISEARDLAAANPAKAAELRSRLDAWRASVGAQLPTRNPHFDPERRWEVRRWEPNTYTNRKY